MPVPKKTILLLGACLWPAGWAGAVLPPEIRLSSDITYSSAYAFRGIKKAGSSFQTNLEAARFVGDGADLYAGAWANLPTGPAENELQYYGGAMVAIPGWTGVLADAGLTVYHFPNTGSDRRHELFLGSRWMLPQFPALHAALFFFYDLDVRSEVGEATLTYSYSLEGIGLPAAFDFSVFGGLQGGSQVKTESYRFYGVSLELPLILGDVGMVTAGVHYEHAAGFTFGPGQRGRNLFWSLGYSSFF